MFTCVLKAQGGTRAATHTFARSFGAKASLDDLLKKHDVRGKRVLVRADLNVPLDKKGGKTITDDTRARESVPTVKRLLAAGAKVVLCSHLGRPDGQVNEKMRLLPVATRLTELLGQPVQTTADCVGPEVEAAVAGLRNGQLLLLENLRFHKQEEKNEAVFAGKLAALGDHYVNDAFGAAHRAHASTEGVARLIRAKGGAAVAGELMQRELRFLRGAVEDHPARPMAAVVGGAKVSSKLPVLSKLLERCDALLLGGGMIFTFYRAQGLRVGASLVEEEMVPLARELLDKAKARGVALLLPSDVVVADKFEAGAASQTVAAGAIPDGWMGLDIGPQTVASYKAAVADCKTVIWNGPMGVFEFPRFAAGTQQLAQALAECSDKGCVTIVGGGDSVAAVQQAGLAPRMSHISTGGGASLELLEGKLLPGVEALEDK